MCAIWMRSWCTSSGLGTRGSGVGDPESSRRREVSAGFRARRATGREMRAGPSKRDRHARKPAGTRRRGSGEQMKLEINGRTVEAQNGDTVLAAARRAGVRIPTLCHYEGLPPSGACRMCVVEVEGQRGLVPSCAFPAAAGIKVQTHSPRAVDARRTLVELLLANHPDDCLYCARNGECQRQDLAEQLGVRRRHYFGGRITAKMDVASPSIVRDQQVPPVRQVRAGVRGGAGGRAIDFIGRGSRTRSAPRSTRPERDSCINCASAWRCARRGPRRNARPRRGARGPVGPSTIVVVQHAPSVSVSLAEEFGPQARHGRGRPVRHGVAPLGFAGSSTRPSPPTSPSWRRRPSWRTASPTAGCCR